MFFSNYTTEIECVTSYPSYASNMIFELYYDSENL